MREQVKQKWEQLKHTYSSGTIQRNTDTLGSFLYNIPNLYDIIDPYSEAIEVTLELHLDEAFFAELSKRIRRDPENKALAELYNWAKEKADNGEEIVVYITPLT